MAKKNSYLTVTDQFCGAGGSSQGVRRYAQRSGLGNGLEVKLALNHWKLAIETHQTNFPEATHDCTDISACDPRRYKSTDILITSPECTNHSVAKGQKQVKAQLDMYAKQVLDPAAERSRATMWDVHRFAEYHTYRIIITENVVDARTWVGWRGWITAMTDLGYDHQPVFLNSMFCLSDAGPSAPQSRDRMYVVFWRKGQRKPDLNICPKAPCVTCGVVNAVQRFKPGGSVKAKYGTQYTYVCPSCAKEVKPFYYAAINAIDWTLPAERIGDRKTPLKARTLERIAYGLKKYGNRPLSVSMLDGERLACRVKDATSDPLHTQNGAVGSAIATPFTMSLNYPEQQSKPVTEAMDTMTSSRPVALVQPFLVDKGHSHAGAKRARGVDAPLRTQAAQDGVGVAMPFLMDSSFTKAKGEYMNAGDEAMNAQTTTQSKGLVMPFLVGTEYDDTKRSKGVDEPMSGQTGRATNAVAIPPALMVSTNYFDAVVRPVDAPLNAQTGAQKMGFVTTLRGTDATALKGTSRGLDEPIGTISAGGFHHALLSGKAMGFLQSYYGGSNVCTGLDDGMSSVSTRERHALLLGQDLTVEDLYFRMLKAHEVKAGMGFDSGYVVLGTQRDQVKQLGNAVTPSALEILTERCVMSLM